MRKALFLWICFLLCAQNVGYAADKSHAALTAHQQALAAYYQSGAYAKDLAAVVRQARTAIQTRLRNRIAQEKLAVVLDIDETTLSNVWRILKERFQADPQKIHAGIMAANSPGLVPMQQLYQFLQREHVAVFFVTGRGPKECQASAVNLSRAGFRDWAGLYCRQTEAPYTSIVPFKSSIRKKLEQKGYTIIANIGDQNSDLAGGHAEQAFKLPNPFYSLP